VIGKKALADRRPATDTAVFDDVAAYTTLNRDLLRAVART
jgi:hypothetical protein